MTYEEVQKVGERSMESLLIRSMQKKTVAVDLSHGKTYEYDSSIYETIIFDCGTNSELVVRPRKVRTKGRKYVRNKISANHPNIVFIVLDSESRKRFENDFPKTITYMTYLRSKRKTNLHQFFKHMAAGYTTRPQFKILFSGTTSKHNEPLWITSKKSGYVTAFSQDICEDTYALFSDEYYEDENNKQRAAFDYQHVETFCSEEVADPDKWHGLFIGPYRTGRRCEFGKDEHVFMFDYFRTLWKMYPNNPKLMTSWINSAHEFTGQGIQWVDKDLVEFLRFFEETGAFENTVLFLMSDHGNHQGFVTNLFQHGNVEDYLPMMYVFLPPEYDGSLYSNEIVKTNTQRIVTFNDIHWTIKRLFLSDNKRKEFVVSKGGLVTNIFKEEVPFERSCKDILYRERKCACINERGVGKNSSSKTNM